MAVIGGAGKEQANTATTYIGPVALSFNTEHPIGGLPAIADLATGRAASCVMATFAPHGSSCERREVPAIPARSPAAVRADVEAAPVVNPSHHRSRSLRIRTRGEVGRRGGRGAKADGKSTDGPDQKLVHFNPRIFALVSSTKA